MHTHPNTVNAVSGNFNIKNGLASTSDLLTSGPRFATSGRGTVNLPQNSLNLTVVLDLKTKNMIPVTANLSGPFNYLKWKIDAAGLLQEAGKNPGGLADRLGLGEVNQQSGFSLRGEPDASGFTHY